MPKRKGVMEKQTPVEPPQNKASSARDRGHGPVAGHPTLPQGFGAKQSQFQGGRGAGGVRRPQAGCTEFHASAIFSVDIYYYS